MRSRCPSRARREPPVRFRVLGAVPDALVLQLGQETRQTSIGDGPGQTAVAHHPSHVQRLLHRPARRLGYHRCSVLSWEPLNQPRCRSSSHSITVVAFSLSSGSLRRRCSISSSHTPSKGSGRVRYHRSRLVSDGTGVLPLGRRTHAHPGHRERRFLGLSFHKSLPQ